MPENAPGGFPNEATAEGSAAYYVARFSAPERCDEVASWLAWFAHLDDMLQRANDPGATRLKLDWWQEEAENALNNNARHPLAQALAPHVSSQWQVQQMKLALQAVEQRILRHQPRDHTDYLAQCSASHGSRTRLLIGSDRSELLDAAERLGSYLATVEHLHHLGQDARKDTLCLPLDGLATHGIDPEALRTGDDVPGLEAMADQLLQRHRIDDKQHLRRHPELHPALRLVAQAQRLERLLRRHAFASHQRHFQLTPLGLLWSAWRMR